MKTIKQQFEQVNKLPLFEIKVFDNENKEHEYILFHIDIYKNQFNMTSVFNCHVLDINEDNTLDEHLECLFDEAINMICNSQEYSLTND